MDRRTKIVATIGPASDSEVTLWEMAEAGMDVARLGLAHGTLDEHVDRYHRVRRVAQEIGKPIGVMVDLPGPKVRTTEFDNGGVEVSADDELVLRAGTDDSTATAIYADYEGLVTDLQPGDRISFGDGQVIVEIADLSRDQAVARVIAGGELMGRPGIRVPSDRLSLATPTDKDLKLLDIFVDMGVDMVALSFVRSAHDVRRVGTEPHPRGPLIVAKIETRAAINNLDGIIGVSGALMVARGDLAADCSIEEIPLLQKQIIRTSVAHGLPVITATQMLDSMVHELVPTRAEATDVANAVFDGASALMLSAETAIGHDPPRVVAMMASIARLADQEFASRAWGENLVLARKGQHEDMVGAVTDAMTAAAVRAVDDLEVAAILCLTATGFTVRSVARFRPDSKILGFSANQRTVNQLTLSWGATPVLAEANSGTLERRADAAIAQARDLGYVRSGELVGVLAGIDSSSPSTDTFRVARVP